MNLNEEFALLVKKAKDNYKKAKRKLTNEEIGGRLGVGGTYVSGMIGGSKKVTRKHINDFEAHFKSELNGVVAPAPPGDPLNRERAMLKVLWQEVAKLKAEKLGVSVDAILDELDRDTILTSRNLEHK